MRRFLAMGGMLWCVAAALWPAVPAAADEREDLTSRIAGRSLPSIFQAWNPADNLPDEDELTTLARHDLFFSGPYAYGLRFAGTHEGLATSFTPESVEAGRRFRAELLERNGHMVLLCEIRYRDARRDYLPADHPWWKRDADSEVVMGWEEGGYVQLDFANPAFRAHVAAQAKGVVETGVVDGVILDRWNDDADDDRLALLHAVRDAVGPDALIMVNPNHRKTPRSAPFVNGYFMECYDTGTPQRWTELAETLAWAEQNLRAPRITCLETWYEQSRQDLHLMRATTTLSMCLSDGYALFSDPNPLPTPDHLHDWYAFWDTEMGKPRGKGELRPDGAWKRAFDKGTAVYNPPTNGAVTIRFDTPHTSAATGQTGTEHTIQPLDGDLFTPRK